MTKKQLSIRLDEDIIQKIDDIANRKRLNRSSLINLILADFTDKNFLTNEKVTEEVKPAKKTLVEDKAKTSKNVSWE